MAGPFLLDGQARLAELRQVARMLKACREFFEAEIASPYAGPPLADLPRAFSSFTSDTGTVYTLAYTHQTSFPKPVASAVATGADGSTREVIVKFVDGEYPADFHRACHAATIAPELLAVSSLVGLTVVVMEALPGHNLYELMNQTQLGITPPALDKFVLAFDVSETAFAGLHAEWVWGDARPPNLFWSNGKVMMVRLIMALIPHPSFLPPPRSTSTGAARSERSATRSSSAPLPTGRPTPTRAARPSWAPSTACSSPPRTTST